MNITPAWQPKETLAVAMSAYYNTLLQRLISEETFREIEELGKCFPVHSSSFWGYEMPLASSRHTADLLLCIHKPEKLVELFSGDPLKHLKNGFSNAHQSAFQQFADAWAANEKKLKETVSNIWFEYDCPARLDVQQTPNFFFAPAQGINSLALIYTAQYVLQNILRQPTAKQTYVLLLKCVQLLNGEGWISQIGMMLGRAEQCLRLFIQDLPEFGIIPYLEKLNYKHAANTVLQAQLHLCYQYCKRVALDIDILFAVGEKIGIECYFDSNEQAITFLNKLYEQQLCTPDKCRFLKAYLEALCFDKIKAFQPFFSHFKLVFAPGAGFAAKAYIGYAETSMARQIIRTKPVKMNAYA